MDSPESCRFQREIAPPISALMAEIPGGSGRGPWCGGGGGGDTTERTEGAPEGTSRPSPPVARDEKFRVGGFRGSRSVDSGDAPLRRLRARQPPSRSSSARSAGRPRRRAARGAQDRDRPLLRRRRLDRARRAARPGERPPGARVASSRPARRRRAPRGSVEKFIGDAVMAVFGVPSCTRTTRCARFAPPGRCGRRSGAERGARPRLRDRDRAFGSGSTRRGRLTGTDGASRDRRRGQRRGAARAGRRARPGPARRDDRRARGRRRRSRAARRPRPEGQERAGPRLAARARSRAEETRRLSAVPMVGRELELQALRDAFAEASIAASCRLVTVVGAAGVGKSRLVSEFLAASTARGSSTAAARLRRRDHLPAGRRGRPGARGRSRAHPDQRVLAALQRLVARRRGELDGGDRVGRAQAPRDRRGGTTARVRLRRRQLGRGHVPRPRRAGRGARAGAPLLVVCMARPTCSTDRPGWGGIVRLDPLSDDEADLLIAELPAARAWTSRCGRGSAEPPRETRSSSKR